MSEQSAARRIDPIEQDKRDRWVPDPAAVAVAVAALKAADPTDSLDLLAAIPMVQPGKTHGWWTIGQEVETVMGAVFLGRNRCDGAGSYPSYGTARNAASVVARGALGEREGTVAWVTVESDGYWSVHED